MSPDAECIFLDLGKVLLDYDFSKFVAALQTLAAVDENQLRRVFKSGNMANRFETGRMSGAEFHREVCDRLDVEIAESDFIAAWNSIFIESPLLPENIMSGLARKRPLWALSNTNPIHFRYARAHFPILRYFKGFILSFNAGSRKPEAAIYLRALEEAKVESSYALFVDDQLPNVEAARGLGFDAFQFQDAGQFTEELRRRSLL